MTFYGLGTAPNVSTIEGSRAGIEKAQLSGDAFIVIIRRVPTLSRTKGIAPTANLGARRRNPKVEKHHRQISVSRLIVRLASHSEVTNCRSVLPTNTLLCEIRVIFSAKMSFGAKAH